MIALALQVCPYDALAALELCALIADLSAGKKSPFEFWLIYRKDTEKPRVQALNDFLCRAFTTVYAVSAPNYADGFPSGCNLLWNSTMLIAGTAKENGTSKAEAFLTFEPDCVPLRRDWVELLDAEWSSKGTPVVGNVVGPPEDPHVNGNALFAVGLLRRHPQLGQFGSGDAWDTYHRHLLMPLTSDTNYIAQDYQRTRISRDELFGFRKHGVAPALFHGVKDGSARMAVRQQLL